MNGRFVRVAGLAFAWVAAAATLPACSKETPTGSAGPTSSSAPAVARPATSAPQAKASSAFSGTYTAKASVVDIGKADKVVKWPPNPASGAIGTGTIDLAVADPKGEVRGEAKGPLGHLMVIGGFDGHDLRANLTPKDPNADDAMTGVMTLVADAAAMRGTLRVSSRDAQIVREATVELSRK
jgi:hypothetical protein